ncbi:hypothetical protein JRO89_XS09G0043800 [Xanthoceras sorbifolium]|uniref:AT-hook motif nuclear-localized protein n=1 Tax=Xanthoceras sorbifolium TaxID=99658 RepID=A0ABQ8HKH6_9ROSI|nr:hypothetical protein JRO89_XS09G0043800 [Xanthoceras sorbifolium]
MDGKNFCYHVVIVPAGEDIVGEVISFFQRSPWALSVTSATGMVSDVIISQAGQYDIISLSGTFRHDKVGGKDYPKGMLSISLAKPDGEVFGGAVAGCLIAAIPVQLTIATFKKNVPKKCKRRRSTDTPSNDSDLRDLQMAIVPYRIPETTDNEENCTTPTTAQFNDITENQTST